MSLELVERIRGVRFTPVRMRAGYAMDVVDDLLDALEQAASQGASLQPMVDAARFPVVKWREGYDMAEVDRFLAEITAAGQLDAQPPTEPAPGPASPGLVKASVIEEQRGALSRLFRRK